MACLYASDYGPPDPGFDPRAEGGALLRGFEDHASVLAEARNPGQLAAMKRQIERGEDVTWCDQGYGWVYDRHLDYLFEIMVAGVILPYIAMRLVQRFRPRPARVPATGDPPVSAPSPGET
jgi:hypothetical protein